MNKKDVFEDKLKRGGSIRTCFDDYDGPDNVAPSAEFIKQKFLEVNKTDRTILAHLTCATDTDNVEKVFQACKEAILTGSVREMGDVHGLHGLQ